MTALVKPLTKILGILFVILGLLGFFVDPLLFFNFETMQNVTYLIAGLAGLASTTNYSYSRLYLIILGVVFSGFGIVGFVNGGDVLDIFRSNASENTVHLIVGVLGIGVGLASRGR